MLLVDEILSGRLYNGKAMELVKNYVQSYVKDLYRPWTVLKTDADMSTIWGIQNFYSPISSK
jgi:hypothetical protein